MNKEKMLMHLYSFAKTYITVFLALYLYQFDGAQEIALFDMAVIGAASKYAFIAVLRNIYKVVTE